MRKKRRWRENEKEKRGKKNERRQENQDQYRKEFKKKCGFGKRKERTERKHSFILRRLSPWVGKRCWEEKGVQAIVRLLLYNQV